MNIVRLDEIGAGMSELIGGKAAGLAELMRAGERVPAGFCVTTKAYTSGVLPEEELAAAYASLGGGRVAVRSSATAEDLPDASFAGQQDTYLDVEGGAELVGAVSRCWRSLRTERAIAYRKANGIAEDTVRMAVVVQRMVRPEVAGVLFTANPVTGNREEMVVDAAPGLGTAVVDGTVIPDHYVLPAHEPPDGCLSAGRLRDLHAAGGRIQAHFGSPQDIEWAVDTDGTLWFLQSRPVTTLFPQPPDTGRPLPRVYLNIGPFQGMHRPFTPMGVSFLRMASAAMVNKFGGSAHPLDGPEALTDLSGHLFADITGVVRNKNARKNLAASLMLAQGPRVAATIERLIADPRFPPQRGLPFRVGAMVKPMLRYTGPAIAGLAGALARPARSRDRAYRAAEEIRLAVQAPDDLRTAEERIRLLTENWDVLFGRTMLRVTAPLSAGMVAGRWPVRLLDSIADDDEIDVVLRGLPHNVTTEMDLELWRIAAAATAHRELLLGAPPTELATRYREGTLPDIGLVSFLARYGHRAAGEIDVGLPRWSEDPTPVFTAIANYLRLDDPEQAPDRRFAAAAAEAEIKLAALMTRARRARPVRGRIAGFLLRRAREIGGMRELLKYAWIHIMREARRQLLRIGDELAARHLLDSADDIMFLYLGEVQDALAGADHRHLVTERRATYARETRRRNVPEALLSDGTDPEALAPATPDSDGALRGMAGSPGVVTGAARVILDPVGARLEPGEILVAPSTDPGWTPLFMTAGGLVTETGGPNSHGPTVAREYGIPAAIGVPRATQHIHTGQTITVDGAAGTVLPADQAKPE